MNQDTAASSGKSQIEEMVDYVCRDFEKRFRDNPAFRIENLLDEIPNHAARIDSGSRRAAAVTQTIAELIFVEMDMRRSAGQPLAAEEYLNRFPDFAPAIVESLDRLRQVHNDFGKGGSIATVTGDFFMAEGDPTCQMRIDQQRQASVPSGLGPYRDISEVNSGGFGIVCRAVDSRDGRVVALKFPRKETLKDDPDLKMFLAEASKAMMLEHPGIVRTHSIEKSDGYLAIVQQFIDGSDLKATTEHKRSHREIARLVAKVAEALAYAHQKGIYHRDLKPGNILIDRQGRPYVADFGLALNESEQIRLPKQRCGTPHYMPPEQVAGLTRLLDGRSDIWSLGVILYELLTKRRPFEGLNILDVFAQIETRDPRPLRQIDPTIDPELQRICLKCLERRLRDRYPTADALADDLHHLAGLPGAKAGPTDTPCPLTPKGLRSYSAEDAEFFLDLLPGPRDRDGLPGSIRFWKTRIVEPVAAENRVPVGVIFGPSGSGKSSFIKAGLLPHLGSEVLTVYIEATQTDTEIRLLKALRKRLNKIPEDITLPELFRGLGYGHWLADGHTKLLIVIDQFEQQLSRNEDPESSQLARAMRYCDGEHLQCLLLTRDDFMMALSRFVDALEMDLREGENAQAIDLFDRKHARKVLSMLGRAYHQLPADPAALSGEQESFLDEAVQQLSDDDHVICVRLALFAEMFRHRQWTPAELKLVGGVAGTGEKFLEASFGPASRDKRLRMQRESAQRVLESLLPAAGTDIRGAMKPEQELIAAANLQNQPGQFDELIKTLDAQLKLITRTDPYRPHDIAQEKPEAASNRCWYQLTHDYLVPSVRSWIESSQNETARGRIRTRFSNLARRWNSEQDNRFLPTIVEFLQARRHISIRNMNSFERSLLNRASNYYLVRSTFAVFFLLFAAAFVLFSVQNQYKALAREYVDRFMTGHPEAVLSNVLLMGRHSGYSRDVLAKRLDTIDSPDQKLRASLGLALLGNRQIEHLTTLVDSISPEFDANSKNIIAALRTFPESTQYVVQRYDKLADGVNVHSSQCRARLAITLCFLGHVHWAAARVAIETTDVQTFFIHSISSWHGDLSGLALFLRDDSAETANAVFCLAFGRLQDDHLLDTTDIEIRAIKSRVTFLHQNCQSSYLLSSSEWLLNRLGAPPSPRDNDVSSIPHSLSSGDPSLWIKSIGLRMHRIEPRLVNLKAFIRGKYHQLQETISKPFYAAEREVTVSDFNLFLADNSYPFEKPVGVELSHRGNLPATRVCYIDAIMYCNWLSRKEELTPAYTKDNSDYPLSETIKNDEVFKQSNRVPLNQWELDTSANGFRLPTCAEWQCLEKSSELDEFDFGSQQMALFVQYYGWLGSNSLDSTNRPVPQPTRQKMPNKLGLFDIYGNAAEFCWDFPFRSTIPLQGDEDFYVVSRGKNCTTQSSQFDAFNFENQLPVTRASFTGFRVVVGFSSSR